MRKLTLCAALLTTTLCAQTSIQTTAPAPASYRDAALGFNYSYPADLQPSTQLSEAVAHGMAGDPKDPDHDLWAKCLAVPLAVAKGLDQPSGGTFGMLVLFRVNHGCMGVSKSFDRLGEMAQMLIGILKGFGHPLTEDAHPYKLDGHEAWLAQGSVAAKALGPDINLHAASTCALVAGNSVCWLLIDSDHKRMPALVASPVTFDGHAPTPLIPRDLLEPW